MSADTIHITPRQRTESAPASVASDAGWNWPLIMRAARGIGVSVFVFIVLPLTLGYYELDFAAYARFITASAAAGLVAASWPHASRRE